MAPPPFIYCRPTYIDGNSEPLFQAAEDGDLDRASKFDDVLILLWAKDIIKSLIKEKGDRTSIFSLKSGGPGVLHIAACRGHLDICKYLVEEHGGDANMIACKGLYEGMTPFMASAQSDNISTVKYFLDLGGDVTKADEGGRTVLHHAACTVTKGKCPYSAFQPNATSIKNGTPLNAALFNRSLKCMTLLIKAGADVNGKMSSLVLATDLGGYTNLIPFLLNAGADPNLANDIKESRDMVKSQADKAFRQKEYGMASELYGVVIDYEPDATLYSNRSLCKLHMGDGQGALSDAYLSRMMRPDWAKACYRQAAAHMLLKEYKQAYDALLDAQKLDPENDEIERKLRKAMELMMTSPDEDQQ
ncbi:hypothetical protein EJB05_16419, partial [Eragrostis curvula]